MSETPKIILDANILIRAVLGKKVRRIIETSAPQRVQFFSPDLCYEDALRYLPILFEKRNLPAQDALEVLEGLRCSIHFVYRNLYQLYEQEARERIQVRDVEDWPIVALALMLDCPIWTEDTDFFGTGIAT